MLIPLTRHGAGPAALPPPDDGLRFELLGPVRAWRGDAEIDLGTPQQRAVLAMLLLAEGHPVPVQEAIDRLWDEHAPRSARGVLRTYVYRLRRALSTERPGSDPIEFDAGAYRFRRAGARVDTDDFSAALRTAKDLRRFDDHAARDALRSALRLWRGEALQGLDADWLQAQRRWWEERRLDALVELFPLELAGGDPGPLLHTLADLRQQQPTPAKLAELTMTGLWSRGERAAALAVYDDLRRTLGAELGIDPDPELQALHLRILRADPAAPDAAPRVVEASAPPVQLPADAPHFVGRGRELAAMCAALTAPRPQHVGIAGLDGMGKTSLAVRVAHAVRPAFPDGQLFVRVGAQGIDGVLSQLLAALGEESDGDLADRVSAWRTRTAGLRLLVVLDDAVAAPDLQLLLPSGSRSAVLVTAQRRILDLPGVRWTRLGPLTTEESVELLGGLAGRARIAREEATAGRLAQECSNVPLAVQVAAARLNDRPHWSVADIEQQLLDDLKSPVVMAEDCSIVDAPLARAESMLTTPALAAFHRLTPAAADGAPFPRGWAAARLGLDPTSTAGLLEELVDANLLVAAPGQHYRFLTLVAAYGRRQDRAGLRRRPGERRRSGVDATSTALRSAGHRPLRIEERFEEGTG